MSIRLNLIFVKTVPVLKSLFRTELISFNAFNDMPKTILFVTRR